MNISKLLLVDDDPIFSKIIQYYVNKVGANISFHVSNNGEEALKYLVHDMPDLILLDSNMPVMNGLKFLRKQAEICSSLRAPVVTITSSIYPDEIAKFNAFDQVKRVYQKPLTYQNFCDLLDEISSMNKKD